MVMPQVCPLARILPTSAHNAHSDQGAVHDGRRTGSQADAAMILNSDASGMRSSRATSGILHNAEVPDAFPHISSVLDSARFERCRAAPFTLEVSCPSCS